MSRNVCFYVVRSLKKTTSSKICTFCPVSSNQKAVFKSLVCFGSDHCSWTAVSVKQLQACRARLEVMTMYLTGLAACWITRVKTVMIARCWKARVTLVFILCVRRAPGQSLCETQPSGAVAATDTVSLRWASKVTTGATRTIDSSREAQI